MVLAFSWSLLLYRTPTRVNLAKIHVLEVDASHSFVLCGGEEETAKHLFLHCEMVAKVWLKVFNWVNVHFITPLNLFWHLDCWSNEVTSKKLRKGFWLIWHVTIWVIWKERNDSIFYGDIKIVDEIVDEIKTLSWVWSINRLKIGAFIFMSGVGIL